MFLSEDPEIALIEGRFKKVPIIIGVNRDESASAVISELKVEMFGNFSH